MSRNVCAGVDGCRGGWLAVVERGNAFREAKVFPTFGALLEALPRTSNIGVDIPIGLMELGSRACDVEARVRLGARRSSVFPAPPRGCLVARSWEDACRRRMKIEGKRVSRQAYGILAKIREVDLVLCASANARRRVVEVHPEVSFTMWNDGQPMAYRKGRSAGKVERRNLIERDWRGEIDSLRAPLRGEKYGADDLHDALAVLWSVHRWMQGSAVILGDGEARDSKGLPMRIIA